MEAIGDLERSSFSRRQNCLERSRESVRRNTCGGYRGKLGSRGIFMQKRSSKSSRSSLRNAPIKRGTLVIREKTEGVLKGCVHVERLVLGV